MAKTKTIKRSIPSLDDVAEQAGVSKSTVSRILNNRLGNGFSVKEQVRQRVIEVARQMNYRPNLIAKSLTMRSTRMIHVFGGNHALSDLGNIYQTVVNHITQVIDSVSEGYDVTVDMSRHTADVSELPAWRIEGAIILAQCTPPTMADIIQLGIPYVIVNGRCPKEGSSVAPDDVGGTRQAIEYLIEQGHTRIAYSGPTPPYASAQTFTPQYAGVAHDDSGLEADVLVSHSSLQDRYVTYRQEIQRHGLEPIVSEHDRMGTAEEYLKRKVFDRGVTAILAYGHMGGLHLLQAAHTLGIAVPEQLSLLCFCDKYANQVMSPGLTFVDLDASAMGKIAAELLLENIQNPTTFRGRHVVLPEKLVLRKTTAHPPGSQRRKGQA